MTAREIAEKIFNSPFIKGDPNISISEGEKMIEDYAFRCTAATVVTHVTSGNHTGFNDPGATVSSLIIDPMSEKKNGEFIYCHCEENLIDRSKSGILSCKNCGKPIK